MSASQQQVQSLPLKTFLQRIGQNVVPNSYVPDTNWGNDEPLLRSDRVNRILMCKLEVGPSPYFTYSSCSIFGIHIIRTTAQVFVALVRLR